MPSSESQPIEEGSRGDARLGRNLFFLPVLAVAAAVFGWWGWKEGAYFGSVFYPGAITIFGVMALILLAQVRLQIDGAARVALFALLGLSAWTLVGIAWTPIRAAALEDAVQAFLYAALFGLGLSASQLLGGRRLLAVAPVALAGAGVGIATTITLAIATDATSYLQGLATLAFPIGYRNANAAFLLICTWPLLAIATADRTRWELRALAIGSATMLLELAVLAQSRGSLPAAAAALLVYLVLSPHRLRAAAVLALAALPVLPALSTLLDLFQHGSADATAVDLLHESARAIAITSGLSVVVAAIAFGWVYPRLNLGARRVRWLSRLAAAAAILVVVVGGAILVERQGGPIEFVDQRVAEFGREGNPDLSEKGTRFGVNIGSNRGDYWRVALDEGADQPLLGGGPGSFSFAYLRNRESPETPQDPHSIELLMFSELGIPGLLLLAAFLGAVVVAGLRARRGGLLSASIVAAGLASGTQWLVHGSYDWLWNYPGVTAPAVYILGTAVAASTSNLGRGRDWAKALHVGAASIVIALALLAVPLFLAERYASSAVGGWRGDLDRAYSDLDRAASLNPYSDRPLLIEAEIAIRVGDRERALSSLREARERVPENYASHFFIARALQQVNPAAARLSLARARALNPDGSEVAALSRRLRSSPPRRPSG